MKPGSYKYPLPQTTKVFNSWLNFAIFAADDFAHDGFYGTNWYIYWSMNGWFCMGFHVGQIYTLYILYMDASMGKKD